MFSISQGPVSNAEELHPPPRDGGGMYGRPQHQQQSLPPPARAHFLCAGPEPLNIPDSPPKLSRRPPKKGNKRETLSDIARRVPVEVIRPYFNYPLRRAAEALCISVTTLKRLCRRHGVKRWPHRQLSGLNRAVSHLEAKRLALKDGPSDPIIADQLRQLYARRNVIIDLAFMTEQEATAARESMHSVKPDYPESPGSTFSGGGADGGGHDSFHGHMSSSGHSLHEPPVMHSGAGTIPWWHRDSGVLAPSSSSGVGSGSGGSSAHHFIGFQQQTQHTGGGAVDYHPRDGRFDGTGGMEPVDETYGYRTSGGHYGLVQSIHDDGDRGGGAGGVGVSEADPDMQHGYRASSSLVRRFGGMPVSGGGGGVPPSSYPTKMEHHQSACVVSPAPSSFKLPSPGTLLAGIPSSAAPPPASAAGSSTPGGGHHNSRRRPMSPMTIGTPGRGGGGGGSSSSSVKSPPPHFIPLPPHHPGDMVDKQIAEFANLNDILFGPDQTTGEMVMDPNNLSTMMPTGGGPQGGGGGNAIQQRGGGGGLGAGGAGEGGRLPSIAGLVAAGQMLNKPKPWSRGCRDTGAGSGGGASSGGGLVRGCTGEV